eukprot:1053736-Alexandrium_andersonii.AAC.1
MRGKKAELWERCQHRCQRAVSVGFLFVAFCGSPNRGRHGDECRRQDDWILPVPRLPPEVRQREGSG